MDVKLSNLEELGLELSPSDLRAAMQPFLANDDGSGAMRWQKEVVLRQQRIIKRLRKRALRGWFFGMGPRSTAKVRNEYDTAWAVGHDRYDLTRREAKYSPWTWNGEPVLFDSAGAARFRLLIYARVIKFLKPHTVLEVGSGDGVNLLLLAGAFPHVSFTGVDLTEQGLAAAMTATKSPVLPPALARYSPLPLIDPQAYRRVSFVQADARALPFASGSFDLVMTVLAVEQMEQVRDAALAEIARVTSRHALNLEPFREVNARGWRRLNVMSRDYFRGAIADLPRFGLTRVWATADFPQEVMLGAALVLSRKG